MVVSQTWRDAGHRMSLLERIMEPAPGAPEFPQVRDTGVSVNVVLGLVAAGRSPAEVVAAHPGLEEEDVVAGLEFLRAILAPPGNPTRAAMRLKMSRRTLVTLMDQLGIPRPRY
jgi:hypothetical protein